MSDDVSSPAASTAGERIAKRMARAGVCSRREAERWIAQGRVAVDGETLTSPAVIVTAASRITIDGELLASAEPTRLWRFHKPEGLVTTNRDPQGRATVFDALPPDLPRVMSVGRLDLNTEGLLLLTNDGELARHLELPSTGWKRRYRVRVHGYVQKQDLAKLAAGLEIDGVQYGAIEAALDRQQGANAWLTMGLREGRNREIRRACEHMGWQVNRLIRIAYGPFQIGSLAKGALDEVATSVLREQLGKDLVARLQLAPAGPKKTSAAPPGPNGPRKKPASKAGRGSARRKHADRRRKP